MIVAVVSQTRSRAAALAVDLGHITPHIFGADDRPMVEGLRADLVFIDGNAQIPDSFVQTIYGTVLKTLGGRVRTVVVLHEAATLR